MAGIGDFPKNNYELDKILRRQALLNETHFDINVPFLTRAIVKEIDLIGGKLDGQNPKNAILARILNISTDDDDGIYYPLFSSHLMLPIKLDEEVWVLNENISNIVNGVWISRVSEQSNTDDLNKVTWDEKKKTNINTKTISKIENNSTNDISINESLISGIKDARKRTVTKVLAEKNVNAQTDEDVFHRKEPVPTYTKRAGDTVIQGSNNTCISLGTDRTSDISSEANKSNAGAIDIVVGRGRTQITQPNITESGKRNARATKENEGDIDFKNDSARIIISMKTNPDANFETTMQGGVNETNVSVFAGKADTIRFIARSSIKIETQSANPSSIVIKPNGEIIIQSDKIKIGSDEALKEPAVLGETLRQLLMDFATDLITGNQSPGFGAPHPGIAKASIALQTSIANILSKKITME